MYVEYKRDVSHNYLILTEEKQINTSSYQVRMLEGNVIPSVLRCRLQGLDGKVLLYYDITSRQSVASFYEQKKNQWRRSEADFWRFCDCTGRTVRVSDESGTVGTGSGVHLSGCRKKRNKILLSSRVRSSCSVTVSGTGRIFSSKAGS